MADIDLINDELERVYQLYGERSRQFRRALYVLIVAALAVFALLVVPFLTFRDQLAAKQAEAAAIAAELQQARNRVAETDASLQAMAGLNDEINDSVFGDTFFEDYARLEDATAERGRDLEQARRWSAHVEDPEVAAWVRGEVERPPEGHINESRLLMSYDRNSCGWKDGNRYLACRLCEDFQEKHRYFTHRVSQIIALTAGDHSAAKADLDAMAGRACGWLVGGAVHWSRGERPEPDGRGALKGMYFDDLRAYAERILALRPRLAELRSEREFEVARLENLHVAASERLEVLENQLGRIAGFDSIGTPVGDLPLGLGQLVLLFPVVLGLAFLVVANSYAGSVELQRAFVRLCRKRDGAGEVMDRSHIAAIAPLWLDSEAPLPARAVKWAILLTPLALMLANLALIAGTSALTTLLPDDSAIPPPAYVVLYAASLALFAGALWHIHRSGREDAAAPQS